MTARGTFSSARNVRSSTAPVRKFLSFVRTNAPPLPGFTCWNSTTVMRPSGRFNAMPFFRSLVETLTLLSLGGGSDDQVLGELGEGHGRVVGDHEGVLDADAADAGEVHAGLDGHHVTRGQGITRRPGHPWGLVDLEADAVARPVDERVGPAGFVDDGAARVVDSRALDSGSHRRAPSL